MYLSDYSSVEQYQRAQQAETQNEILKALKENGQHQETANLIEMLKYYRSRDKNSALANRLQISLEKRMEIVEHI